MDEKNCVDIVIPLYNNEKFISEAVESVVNQSYTRWKLIVVDDGSTDSSKHKVEEVAANNERIQIIRAGKGPKGACYARNLGFRHGKSSYVIFLDSDDLLEESCIERRITCMLRKPDLDFALGSTLLFDSNKYDLDIKLNVASMDATDDLYRFLKQDMPWHTMSPLWKRESFQRLGGWNETLASFQDWELHIRACYAGLHYELSSEIPDSFYRRPDPGRNSIASSYMTEKKINSRFDAVRSVASLRGFMGSKKRREYVEAFCLRNALQILDSRDKKASLVFLRKCILSGLFRPINAVGAVAIVLRGKNWRGSSYAQGLRHMLWPGECRIDPWEKVECGA